MQLRMEIDVKSLYANIKNDNKQGHTATVNTPLKQGNGYHESLLPVLSLPENLSTTDREAVISQIMSHSRAEAKIVKICVFDNITVNGIKVNNKKSFCLYIREETGIDNVHCGRQKVHYPTSLSFSGENVEIDNGEVMKSVSEALNDYAFIVEAFDYDSTTDSFNFDASVVGYNGIPYSKVFINHKGVGNKFASEFSDDSDSYDAEIIALRKHFGFEKVGPGNYFEIMNNNRAIAFEEIKNYLRANGISDFKCLSDDYPYSLYDFEYNNGFTKKYIIVRYTSTRRRYFNLSMNKVRFCNNFSDKVLLLLVMDVNECPTIKVYDQESINNMKKTIKVVSFDGGGIGE